MYFVEGIVMFFYRRIPNDPRPFYAVVMICMYQDKNEQSHRLSRRLSDF